jgi:hypothetical protein
LETAPEANGDLPAQETEAPEAADTAAPVEAQTNELSAKPSQKFVDHSDLSVRFGLYRSTNYEQKGAPKPEPPLETAPEANGDLPAQETEAPEAADTAAPVEAQTNELSGDSSQETVDQAASGEVEAQA